jgi:secreted PhoX family phosphatase
VITRLVIATGAVTTLAGSGPGGSADGTGAAASFSRPGALAVDRAGNLFVSDRDNYTIRQVVVATGVVTTLAGSARNPGFTDGTAGEARFGRPMGLASDGAGNLFVADTYSHTIRRIVTATGVVTTLAGSPPGLGDVTDGAGASVHFKAPKGLAGDGAGDVFVADSQNHTIRRFVAATGAVTTLAGSPGQDGHADGTGSDARFVRPQGLASDGAGNLFITTDAHTIRKLAIATGMVTTLAGLPLTVGAADGTGSAARFNSPQGLASDGSGNLFVADSLNHIIRRVVVATGAVTTLAGSAGMSGDADGTGSAARFSSPAALASDGAGNVFVADAGNGTIRKVIVSSGDVTTLAGSAGMFGSTDGTGPAARFYGPSALAYDGSGNLLVAESGNGTVRNVDIATGGVTTLVGSPGAAITLGPLPAGLNAPVGLALGPAGRLYIIDENALLVVQ